jgi:RHS repeat-associated protein
LTDCFRAGARCNYPFLTQKERDIETGLDYFGARYYSSTQGRFTSADSLAGSRTNPQTLNLYSYTGNNPLRFVDPTGHYFVDHEAAIKDDQQKPKPDGGDAPPCWPKCGLYPGQAPVINETVTVTAGESSPITTTSPDMSMTLNLPGSPENNPGETPFERYTFSPKQTALEVIDWASKGVRRFGYAITPDYGFINFGVPLVASGSLQYSKDRQWYYSLAGPTAGAKNFKVGGQVGFAYFATTGMNPEQRDSAIQGPGLNVTTPFNPVGAYFPSSGRPAITFGWPFSAGVNGSKTWPWRSRTPN